MQLLLLLTCNSYTATLYAPLEAKKLLEFSIKSNARLQPCMLPWKLRTYMRYLLRVILIQDCNLCPLEAENLLEISIKSNARMPPCMLPWIEANE